MKDFDSWLAGIDEIDGTAQREVAPANKPPPDSLPNDWLDAIDAGSDISPENQKYVADLKPMRSVSAEVAADSTAARQKALIDRWVPRVKTDADYEAIQPGTVYIGQDGKPRKKTESGEDQDANEQQVISSAIKADLLSVARSRMGTGAIQRGDVPESSFPNVTAWAQGLGSTVESMRQRVLGGEAGDEAADMAQMWGDAYRQAADERSREKGVLPPIVSRGIRGAAETIPPMVVAGQVAGPYASILAASATEADKAITTGREAGLSGGKLAAYAAAQAAAEGSLAAIMQRAGLGGAESAAAAKKLISESVLGTLKRLGINTLAELGEENATELLHNVVNATAGVDEMSWEKTGQTAADTTVQTLVTMGFLETPNAVARLQGRAARKASPSVAGPQQSAPEVAPPVPQKQEDFDQLVGRILSQGKTDAEFDGLVGRILSQGRQDGSEQTKPTSPTAAAPDVAQSAYRQQPAAVGNEAMGGSSTANDARRLGILAEFANVQNVQQAEQVLSKYTPQQLDSMRINIDLMLRRLSQQDRASLESRWRSTGGTATQTSTPVPAHVQTAAEVKAAFEGIGTAAREAGEKRTRELVAKNGYVGFRKDAAVQAFRSSHPGWIEDVVDGETRFRPPDSQSDDSDNLVGRSPSQGNTDGSVSTGANGAVEQGSGGAELRNRVPGDAGQGDGQADDRVAQEQSGVAAKTPRERLASAFEGGTGWLKAIALSKGLQDADANDAVQNSVLQALKKIDQFDATKDIKPWLRAIAENEIVNIMRKRKRLATQIPDGEVPVSSEGTGEENAIARESVTEEGERLRLEQLDTKSLNAEYKAVTGSAPGLMTRQAKVEAIIKGGMNVRRPTGDSGMGVPSGDAGVGDSGVVEGAASAHGTPAPAAGLPQASAAATQESAQQSQGMEATVSSEDAIDMILQMTDKINPAVLKKMKPEALLRQLQATTDWYKGNNPGKAIPKPRTSAGEIASKTPRVEPESQEGPETDATDEAGANAGATPAAESTDITSVAADEIGADARKLRSRLTSARNNLVAEMRNGFGAGTLDFEAKTLTGNNGVVLQWANDGKTRVGSVTVGMRGNAGKDAPSTTSGQGSASVEPSADAAFSDAQSEIEFRLSEIDKWRSGEKGTAALPATGERYPREMQEEIKRHEKRIAELRASKAADATASPSPSVEPKAKQPWDMTKEEWTANARDALARWDATLPEAMSQAESRRIREAGGKKAFEVKGEHERGRRPYLDAIQKAEQFHQNQVYRAVAEGKPVRADVLADYPDLQPKAPSTAGATQTEGKEPWDMTRFEWFSKNSAGPPHMADSTTHGDYDALKAIDNAVNKDKFAQPFAKETEVDQHVLRRLAKKGYIKLLGSSTNGRVTMGVTGRMAMSAVDADKEYRQIVQSAIDSGKIKSHPDYPEMKAKTSPPAAGTGQPARLDVYPLTINGEQRFAVHMGNPSGLGDTVFKTRAEAEQEVVLQRKRDAESQLRAERLADQDKADAAAKADREDIDGFAADADPLTRGKIVATLNKQVRVDGKVITRKQHIRDAVKRGAIIKQAFGEDRITLFDGRVKKAGGGYQEGVEHYLDVTKTEVDYAKYLIDKRSQSASQPAPTQPPQAEPPAPAAGARTPEPARPVFLNIGTGEPSKAVNDMIARPSSIDGSGVRVMYDIVHPSQFADLTSEIKRVRPDLAEAAEAAEVDARPMSAEAEPVASAGYDAGTAGKIPLPSYKAGPGATWNFPGNNVAGMSTSYGLPDDFYVDNRVTTNVTANGPEFAGGISINDKYDPKQTVQAAVDKRDDAIRRKLYEGTRRKFYDEQVQQAAAAVVATARDTMQPAAAPPPKRLDDKAEQPRTIEDLQRQIRSSSPDTITEEQSSALGALVRGVSSYLGVTPGEYIQRRFRGVERGGTPSDDALFSVAPQMLADKLDSEPTIRVFRAMQLIDGKLYPPMSAVVEGRLREPTQIGVWEVADEQPELTRGGKFTLNKGNKSSIAARYNPYFHTSRTPLNDQFSSASARPNLVTVEVEVPAGELTSGYKAEGAKDSVGEIEWHAGPVSSRLPAGKRRRVILSRYSKAVRVVPDAEVAGEIAELLRGEGLSVPESVVTPSLRDELVKRGVSVAPSGVMFAGGSDAASARASVEFDADSRALVRALRAPTVADFVHELGHIFRRDLNSEDLRIAEDWAVVRDGHWTRDSEERFADGFEQYVAEGVSPTAELKGVFAKFKEWISKIYKAIVDGGNRVQLSDEMRLLFSRMIGSEASPASTKRLDDKVAPQDEKPTLQKGDVVKWDKQEAEVMIPDLGPNGWTKNVARIKYTTGPKAGQFQEVEAAWLTVLKPEETQAGKVAAEGARVAAEKAAKDKASHDERVESIAVVVRKARKQGMDLSPKTKKAKAELVSNIQMAHGTRNDAATLEAIAKVAAEPPVAEPDWRMVGDLVVDKFGIPVGMAYFGSGEDRIMAEYDTKAEAESKLTNKALRDAYNIVGRDKDGRRRFDIVSRLAQEYAVEALRRGGVETASESPEKRLDDKTPSGPLNMAGETRGRLGRVREVADEETSTNAPATQEAPATDPVADIAADVQRLRDAGFVFMPSPDYMGKWYKLKTTRMGTKTPSNEQASRVEIGNATGIRGERLEAIARALQQKSSPEGLASYDAEQAKIDKLLAEPDEADAQAGVSPFKPGDAVTYRQNNSNWTGTVVAEARGPAGKMLVKNESGNVDVVPVENLTRAQPSPESQASPPAAPKLMDIHQDTIDKVLPSMLKQIDAETPAAIGRKVGIAKQMIYGEAPEVQRALLNGLKDKHADVYGEIRKRPGTGIHVEVAREMTQPDVELKPIERTTPAKGTAERDAINDEYEASSAKLESVRNLVDKLAGERDKAKPYSKKREQIATKLAKASEALDAATQSYEPIKNRWYIADAEDRVESAPDEATELMARAVLNDRYKDANDRDKDGNIRRVANVEDVYRRIKALGVVIATEMGADVETADQMSVDAYQTMQTTYGRESLRTIIGRKLQFHNEEAPFRAAAQQIEGMELDARTRFRIDQALAVAKRDPEAVARVVEDAKASEAALKKAAAEAKELEYARAEAGAFDASIKSLDDFEGMHHVQDAGLAAMLREVSRYDAVETAKQTGIAVEGRFMVKLPNKDLSKFGDVTRTNSKTKEKTVVPHTPTGKKLFPTDMFNESLAGERESTDATIIGGRVDTEEVKGETETTRLLLLEGENGRREAVNARFHDIVMLRHPKAKMRLGSVGATEAVFYQVGDETVGIVIVLGNRPEGGWRLRGKERKGTSEPTKHRAELTDITSVNAAKKPTAQTFDILAGQKSGSSWSLTEAETPTGRELLDKLKKDADGNVGIASIMRYLGDELGTLTVVGNSQLSSKHPAVYYGDGEKRSGPHLIRSKSGVSPLFDFHEFGHATSRLLHQIDPKWMQTYEPELVAIAKLPGSLASAESAEEGFAEFYRRYLSDYQSIPDALRMLVERRIGLMDKQLLDALKDAHRAYQYHLGRPVLTRIAAEQNDRIARPKAEPISSLWNKALYYVFGANAALHNMRRKMERPLYRFSRKLYDNFLARTQGRRGDVDVAYNYTLNVQKEVARAIAGDARVDEGVRFPVYGHDVNTKQGTTRVIGLDKDVVDYLRQNGFNIPDMPKQEGDYLVLSDRPFASIIRAVGNDNWSAFDAYGHLKASIERANAGQEQPWQHEHITIAEAQRAVDEAELQNPEWEQQFREVTKYFDALLVGGVLSGEFTPSEIVAIRNKWDDYWPLLRQVPGGGAATGAGLVPSSGVKRTFGSGKPYKDLMEAVQFRTQSAIMAYATNGMRRSVIDFSNELASVKGSPSAVRTSGARIALKLNLDMKVVAKLSPEEQADMIAKEINRMMAEAQGIAVEDLADTDKVDKEQLELSLPWKTIFRPTAPKTVNVIGSFGPNGLEYHQLTDPLIANMLMLSSNKRGAWSLLAKAYTGIVQPWKRNVTESLPFAARNPVRDVPTAMIRGQGWESLIPGVYHAVGLVDMALGSIGLTKDLPMRARKIAEIGEELDRAGHRNLVARFFGGLREAATTGIVVPGWGDMTGWERLASVPGVLSSALSSPVSVFNYLTGGKALSAIGEEAPRRGAYRVARMKGESQEQSQMLHDEITGLFSQRQPNQAVADFIAGAGFLNPGLQILFGQYRSFTDPDPRVAQHAFVKLGGVGMLAAATAAVTVAVSRSILDDDEYDEMVKDHSERSETDKMREARFLGVRFPFDGGPVGATASFFYNTAMDHFLDAPDQTADRLQAFYGRVVDMPGPSDAIMPHLKTAMEVNMGDGGYSFYRSDDIVPEHLITAYPANPEMRAYEDTPELWKAVGRGLGVSPLKVEYAMRSLFTRQLTDAVSFADKLSAGKSLEVPYDLPIARAVTSRPNEGFRSDSVKRVKEAAREVDAMMVTAKSMKPGPDRDALLEKIAEVKESEIAFDAINRIWENVKGERERDDPDREAIAGHEKRMTAIARQYRSYLDGKAEMPKEIQDEKDRHYLGLAMKALASFDMPRKPAEGKTMDQTMQAWEKSRDVAVSVLQNTPDQEAAEKALRAVRSSASYRAIKSETTPERFVKRPGRRAGQSDADYQEALRLWVEGNTPEGFESRKAIHKKRVDNARSF